MVFLSEGMGPNSRTLGPPGIVFLQGKKDETLFYDSKSHCGSFA